MDLNSRDIMKALDPNGMLELIEGFADQVARTVDIARAAELRPLNTPVTHSVVTGMGGSAAGGDFVRSLLEAQGTISGQVNRDYTLPNYVGPSTVVVCASYSGNTEETLSAYDDARRRGARILVVTSGGEILRRARADGADVIVVPGGQPPRSALGYMLVPIIVAFERWGLLPAQPWEAGIARIYEVANDLGVNAPDNGAKIAAQAMHGRIGVVYGLGAWPAAIANRWRCQFNENAKYLLFNNGYPELDHNEIMGWVAANQQSDRFAGIRLQGGDESPAMRTRATVTEGLIADKCAFGVFTARGESLLERMLSLAHMGDWVSIYVARLNNVDPTVIPNIDRLKEELAKLQSN